MHAQRAHTYTKSHKKRSPMAKLAPLIKWVIQFNRPGRRSNQKIYHIGMNKDASTGDNDGHRCTLDDVQQGAKATGNYGGEPGFFIRK